MTKWVAWLGVMPSTEHCTATNIKKNKNANAIVSPSPIVKDWLFTEHIYATRERERDADKTRPTGVGQNKRARVWASHIGDRHWHCSAIRERGRRERTRESPQLTTESVIIENGNDGSTVWLGTIPNSSVSIGSNNRQCPKGSRSLAPNLYNCSPSILRESLKFLKSQSLRLISFSDKGMPPSNERKR